MCKTTSKEICERILAEYYQEKATTYTMHKGVFLEGSSPKEVLVLSKLIILIGMDLRTIGEISYKDGMHTYLEVGSSYDLAWALSYSKSIRMTRVVASYSRGLLLLLSICLRCGKINDALSILSGNKYE